MLDISLHSDSTVGSTHSVFFYKYKIEFQKIQLLFSKFKKQFLNFQLQSFEYSDNVTGNSETWNRNNFTFWVNEVSCSYTEKSSLVKFIEVFKSWGFRHLQNSVP